MVRRFIVVILSLINVEGKWRKMLYLHFCEIKYIRQEKRGQLVYKFAILYSLVPAIELICCRPKICDDL